MHYPKAVMLAAPVAAVAMTLVLASSAAAEQVVGRYGSFVAKTPDDFVCKENVLVNIEGPSAAEFEAKKESDLRILIGGALEAIRFDCDNVTGMKFLGLAGGAVVYRGIAAERTGWNIVSLGGGASPPVATAQVEPPAPSRPAASNQAASSSGGANASDPFSAFRNQPEGGSSASGSGASAAVARPAQPAPAPSAGRRIDVYCSGYINTYIRDRYYENKRAAFEFKTRIDFGANRHTVLNVLKGPLFREGASYGVVTSNNTNVSVLSADTTNSALLIDKVRLDLSVNKLTGTGGVDGTERRQRMGRVVERLKGRTETGKILDRHYGSQKQALAERGIDSWIRLEVDGVCEAVG